MRLLLHASLAGALLVLSTGCLTVRANTPEALNIPEPPARVVTPPAPPAEPPPPVTLAPPTPTTTPSPPDKPTTNPPSGGSTTRPAQNTTPPATSAPPPDNPPVLQTTREVQELESKTKWQLDTAKRDLDRVDPRRLTRDGQAQYYSALGLWKAADDAFKVKNFNYAYPQAQKAALMAAQLPKGRPEPSPTSF